MKIKVAMSILALLIALLIPYVLHEIEARRHAEAQRVVDAIKAETAKHIAESEKRIEQMNRCEELARANRSASEMSKCGEQ